MKFIFFGTDNFSVEVLNTLKAKGFLPEIIVTAPDRPADRGHKIKKPEVKIWAEENKINFLQPEIFDANFFETIGNDWDFFALASFGKIIPKKVLEIPKKGTLNVHPSLLPKYRGASPIESAILKDDKTTGVTIMLMDEKMDHGPILTQEVLNIDEWPTKKILESDMAKIGGKLLAQTIDNFINKKTENKNVENTSLEKDILAQEQNHDMATFTQKNSKKDGLVNFHDIVNLQNLDRSKQREIFLKIQAFNPWPSVYFFLKKAGDEIRVKITEASWNEESLEIIKVIPAGKNEMSWINFQNGFLKDLFPTKL